MTRPRRPFLATPRLGPVAGVLVGLLGAAIYWLGAQVWPDSVAVALAMAAMDWAMAAFAQAKQPPAAGPFEPGPVFWVLVLLVKYNALMALTAAAGPFPLPPHLTLGLIMIAGQAAAAGLAVSLMTDRTEPLPRAGSLDLAIALIAAFAPAAVLGIPGLVGLVAAIVARLLLVGRILPRFALGPLQRREVTRHMAEACFYLGAVATWRYV